MRYGRWCVLVMVEIFGGCFDTSLCLLFYVPSCLLLSGRGRVFHGVYGENGVGASVPQLFHQRLDRSPIDLSPPHHGLAVDGEWTRRCDFGICSIASHLTDGEHVILSLRVVG